MDDQTLLGLDEEWRSIPGFEDRYEVSDRGRVRSLRMINAKVNYLRGAPKIMAGSRDKDGRHRIVLHQGERRLACQVGVLVLMAFVGPRPEKHDCRHIDGNASNDRLTNLQWSTHAVNMADKNAHGTFVAPPARRGTANNKAVLTEDDIRCIRAEPFYRGVNTMLGRAFGVLPSSIGNIRAGRSWKDVGQWTT